MHYWRRKNTDESRRHAQIAAVARAWRLIPALMGGSEAFKRAGEVTAGVLATAREQESEVEPEDLTELLHPHDKAFTDDELFLMQEQRSAFLRGDLLLVKML